jgi:hypothetical protein
MRDDDDWVLRHFSPVREARYVRDYTIWLRFEDGVEGEIDLSDELWHEYFEELRDVDFFKRFFIDGETLMWPNGEDIACEFLHEKVLERVAATRPV